LNSDLNSEIHFQGKGTNFTNINFNIIAKANNSRFANFNFKNLIFNARTDSLGKIKLDTLLISFNPLDNSNLSKKNKIFLKAIIDFSNERQPEYIINSDFNGINLASLLDNNNLPDLVNGNFHIKGSGFHPDSINANIKINLSKMRIHSNTIYSKKLSCNINRDDNKKEININSDFFKANISGKFSYLSLLNDLSLQSGLIQNYVTNKLNSVKGNDSLKLNSNEIDLINPRFTDANLSANFQFNDDDILKAFLNYDIFKSYIKLNCNIKTSKNKSNIKIDSLFIKKFHIKSKNTDFVINPILLKANINSSIQDSNISLSSMKFTASSKYSIFFNDISINRPEFYVFSTNNKVDLGFNFTFNNDISFKSKGFLKFDSSKVDLELKNTSVLYKKMIKFTSVEPIKANFQNNTLAVNNFHFKSNLIDEIELSGKINSEKFDNVKINLKKFDLKSIRKIDNSRRAALNDLKGIVNNVNISLNGAYDKLDEKIYFNLSSLKVNKTLIGDVSANISHKNNNISGIIDIQKGSNKKKLFSLNIDKLPLNLSIEAPKNRYDKTKPVALEIKTSNLPLELFSPFTNQISKLKGYADLDFHIEGKSTKTINYKGDLRLRKARFLLNANNMNYLAYGKIHFKTDTITLNKFILENDRRDISHGKINISAMAIFENLKLKHYDVKILGKKFQVLSKASMKSIPMLYGDLVLSFGPSPVHIFGNEKNPTIRGDINLLRSNLIMPSTENQGVKKSRLIYEIKQNEINYKIVKDSSQEKSKKKIKKSRSKEMKSEFSNNLDIDLRIFFKGRFVTTMDITGIGQLFAEIGTANPDMALRFVLNRGDDQPKIFGSDLIVKEGSTLKFIKILNTSGKISFQKGGLKNPDIDFVATYEGQRYLSDEVSNYKVFVYIKGTKEKPVISFRYSINGREAVGDSSKINENAILLLAIGKTKDEMLSKNTGSGNLDIMAPASSFASAAMSTALTDFVQSTGFIQSADIDIGNSLTDLNQAKMKFSGEVKGIRWTLGGTVADFASNNEISIDIPQNIDIGVDFINHIILQLTKSTNSTQSAASRNQKDWEIKLKVGGSW